MFSTTRRCAVLLLLGCLLSVAASACGGGKSSSPDGATSSPGGSTPTSVTNISGTYVVVKDSDGTGPKDGATVTLVLTNGKLSVRAVADDGELADTGTYSVKNGRMTIEFVDQQISATDQPYKLDGDTLEIPVKMFSEGAGSSTWKRTAAEAADAEPTPAEDEEAAPGDAPRVPGGISALEADWDLFDLEKYATAAAMKTFVEGVNDGGMTWENAVKAAVDKAKTFSDVSGVELSPNGLNAVIRYKDGHDEELLTERQSVTEGGLSASGARSSERYVSAVPAPSAKNACVQLPGSPSGVAKTSRGNLAQPGREGIQPRGTLFGVSNYNSKKQPKPITSADSPPATSRKALLFAPLYDVSHPGPVYKDDVVVAGTWSGFREASNGNNIECISADLKRGGYVVDTILGRMEKGKPVETGIDAIVKLTKKLMAGEYGAIYFMTHGAAPDASVIKLEMGTLSDADRNAVIGERKIRHEEMTTLEDAIREKILREAGLPLDDDFKKTIRANVEINGRLEIWVSSEFFRLLRTKMSVSFANTLVFVNACSSAANAGLVNAFDAKAFFGFQRPPDLSFSSDAAQTIFDLLPDRARSARDAWSMWARYERWLEAASGVTRPDRTKVDILKAYGKSGVEYAGMADQTVILIYKMRHGPTSGASDITKSMGIVQSCSQQFWSSGTSTGLKSPACHNLEFGSHLPTDDEVADAVFEVGGGGDLPYGRWTMTD